MTEAASVTKEPFAIEPFGHSAATSLVVAIALLASAASLVVTASLVIAAASWAAKVAS